MSVSRWSHVGPGLSREDRDVLFVFGSARSGTTFLNKLLGRYYGFGMGPEGTFVARFARRLKRYGDLGDEANLDRLIDDVSRCEMLTIARERYKPHKRYDVTPKAIRDNLLEPSFAGVVYSVLQCMADAQNRPRVGNKNPGYWKNFDLLHRLFPTQARYLTIVRDGRDVALSNMKTPWGQSSFYTCAASWVAMHESLKVLEQQVGSERVLVVRYEDILQDPRPTLERIRAFAAPDLEDEKLEEATRSIVESDKRQNFDKWRDEMSPTDLRIYEAVAGSWLESFGYARGTESPQVSATEKTWYEVKEYARIAALNLKLIGQRDRPT